MIDVRDNNVFYLETSSINYLVDNFNIDSIKQVIDRKSIKFYISVVTISEILMTKKYERKESLIDCIKELCDVELLVSPTEIVLNYIKHGMPKNEPCYNLSSKESLSKVWADIKECEDKTFLYDYNEISYKIKYLQTIFKEQLLNITNDIYSNKYYLNDYISRYEDISVLNKDSILERKIAWIILFLLLSADINLFDREMINNFWKAKGISSVEDSIKYIVKELGRLTYIGPIAVMSKMFAVQYKMGTNRGTLYDMLHSVYLIYASYFLTHDNHFIDLKNSYSHPNFIKINDISDVIVLENQ